MCEGGAGVILKSFLYGLWVALHWHCEGVYHWHCGGFNWLNNSIPQWHCGGCLLNFRTNCDMLAYSTLCCFAWLLTVASMRSFTQDLYCHPLFLLCNVLQVHTALPVKVEYYVIEVIHSLHNVLQAEWAYILAKWHVHVKHGFRMVFGLQVCTGIWSLIRSIQLCMVVCAKQLSTQASSENRQNEIF